MENGLVISAIKLKNMDYGYQGKTMNDGGWLKFCPKCCQMTNHRSVYTKGQEKLPLMIIYECLKYEVKDEQNRRIISNE